MNDIATKKIYNHLLWLDERSREVEAQAQTRGSNSAHTGNDEHWLYFNEVERYLNGFHRSMLYSVETTASASAGNSLVSMAEGEILNGKLNGFNRVLDVELGELVIGLFEESAPTNSSVTFDFYPDPIPEPEPEEGAASNSTSNSTLPEGTP